MNILFISSEQNPFIPPKEGGEQRTQLLLRACSNVAKVDIVAFTSNVISNHPACKVIYSGSVNKNNQPTICKNILLNLSNQTLYSMFKAGCGSVKLYTYMSDFSSFKLLPKIARVFWAFRKPYEEWYSNHTEKYLG